MKPSSYQQAIFDFIANGKGSAVVQAVAGSGKTTTIVEATKLISPSLSTLFLAFNKSIAEELGRRCPPHVKCMTLNALGHRAVGSAFGKIKIDGYKTREMIYREVDAGRMSEDDARNGGAIIKKLVSIAKAVGLVPSQFQDLTSLTPDTMETWQSLITHYDIQIGSENDEIAKETQQAKAIGLARQILAVSIEERSLIDFDDQLYFPVIFDLPVAAHDFVFVDEAQDVSPIQRALLFKSLKKNGRLVAVGDSHQAIYGFRGADSDSLENITKVFNCTQLPLSISYRCPKSVVFEAQEIVPHIEAHEAAPEGSVTDLGNYKVDMFKAGDMVVCRATAPVVKLAYALIANRVPARVMGREIGSGLVALIEKLNAKGIPALIEKLDAWKKRETARLLKRDPEADLSVVEDKYDCIMCFINFSSAQTIPALIQAVESLFGNDARAEDIVTLSTIHKAKGLEADRVFFLDSWMLPSKYARLPHQHKQEMNLKYVAVTRAKKELIYVTTPKQ